MGVKPTTFEFSPPYGDGTAIPWPADDWKRFSPPYGDSTDFDKYGIVELFDNKLAGVHVSAATV